MSGQAQGLHRPIALMKNVTGKLLGSPLSLPRYSRQVRRRRYPWRSVGVYVHYQERGSGPFYRILTPLENGLATRKRSYPIGCILYRSRPYIPYSEWTFQNTKGVHAHFWSPTRRFRTSIASWRRSWVAGPFAARLATLQHRALLYRLELEMGTG